MDGELELGDWHPRSPSRRPHWRWLRATWLADSLRDHTLGAYLAGSAGTSFGDLIGTAGYQAYRDKLLRQASDPRTPSRSS